MKLLIYLLIIFLLALSKTDQEIIENIDFYQDFEILIEDSSTIEVLEKESEVIEENRK